MAAELAPGTPPLSGPQDADSCEGDARNEAVVEKLIALDDHEGGGRGDPRGGRAGLLAIQSERLGLGHLTIGRDIGMGLGTVFGGCMLYLASILGVARAKEGADDDVASVGSASDDADVELYGKDDDVEGADGCGGKVGSMNAEAFAFGTA